ncbi:hypothetical protein C8Q80DRAFT_1097013, partial [Daedaleopsis nitida]
SWWLKPSIWGTTGMYMGIWNPQNKQWFQNRLKEIKAGSTGLMKMREWRYMLGQYRPCGKLAKIVNAMSSEIIDKNLL